MNLTDNADMFLNSNSDLFDGLTEEDLAVPEKLIFFKNEVVTGTILDISIIDKIGAVKAEVKVETGDHAGKIHELTVFKPKVVDGKQNVHAKKNWVEFLLAFFTKEEVLKGGINFDKFVGQKLTFTAGEAKEYQGKARQNFSAFKLEATPF